MPHVKINTQEILALEAVRDISNVKDVDICFAAKDTPLRIKQTSSLELVQAFNKIEKAMDKMLKVAADLSNEIKTPLLLEYENMLSRLGCEESALPLLIKYHGACVVKLAESLNVEHQELLPLMALCPED